MVQPHGGPEAADPNGWNGTYSRWGQMLAGQGFLTLYPNYRGSIGRGVREDRGVGEHEPRAHGRHLRGVGGVGDHRAGLRADPLHRVVEHLGPAPGGAVQGLGGGVAKFRPRQQDDAADAALRAGVCGGRVFTRWSLVSASPLHVTGRRCVGERVARWRPNKEAAKRAGVEERVYAHLLRHACGTETLETGDLRDVQVLLGHRHRKTTEIYALPDASAAIDAILRFG